MQVDTVIDILRVINWKSSALAQVSAILLIGTGLGLLCILDDLAFSQGVAGWIVTVVGGIPVYVFAALLWDKIFLPDREASSAGAALSWKRIGTGVAVALGSLLVASGIYLLTR